MQKTIVFVGGYARSGKTTALSYLAEQGYGTVSTSAILYEFAANLFSGITDWKTDEATKVLADKSSSFEISFTAYHGREENCSSFSGFFPHRKFIIALAEDVLVKTFGRQIFARTATIRALQSDSPLVFVETVGGEEFSQMLLALNEITGTEPEETQPTLIKLNMRRTEEQAGVDIRQLLTTDLEIWSDGSVEETQKELDTLVAWVLSHD
jgi:hypothetical protein